LRGEQGAAEHLPPLEVVRVLLQAVGQLLDHLVDVGHVVRGLLRLGQLGLALVGQQVRLAELQVEADGQQRHQQCDRRCQESSTHPGCLLPPTLVDLVEQLALQFTPGRLVLGVAERTLGALCLQLGELVMEHGDIELVALDTAFTATAGERRQQQGEGHEQHRRGQQPEENGHGRGSLADGSSSASSRVCSSSLSASSVAVAATRVRMKRIRNTRPITISRNGPAQSSAVVVVTGGL
jgi:hypothetical protein